jgi:hypothetical protein
MDLSGQWLSLTRTVKRSTSTFRGKIRVKNLGGQAAPGSVLEVYQSADSVLNPSSDLLIGRVNVSNISEGGYVDVSPRMSAPYNGLPVYLFAVLDATNLLSETDESNNKIVSALVP